MVLDGPIQGEEGDPDHPPRRCRACLAHRLHVSALAARGMDAQGFTTTLLLSKYKPHDWIRRAGTRLGSELGIPFVYADLRRGWGTSLKESRELELYRQPYCGCIFSEWERFGPKDP